MADNFVQFTEVSRLHFLMRAILQQFGSLETRGRGRPLNLCLVRNCWMEDEAKSHLDGGGGGGGTEWIETAAAAFSQVRRRPQSPPPLSPMPKAVLANRAI